MAIAITDQGATIKFDLGNDQEYHIDKESISVKKRWGFVYVYVNSDYENFTKLKMKYSEVISPVVASNDELITTLLGYKSSASIPVGAAFVDSPNLDAFARLRVSNPRTIFDSKQLFDNAPLFWDDSQETGAGTTSTHDPDTASSTIGVALNTAGKRTRQTFMRFNYQPGKSQLIFATFNLFKSGGGTGITRTVGYGDDNNGIFLRDNEGTVEMLIRTNTSGTVAESAVAQSAWNLDKMDGTGASGVTLDFTKTQILIIDFEWLGVGRVRTGFVIDGIPIYTHEFNNANNLGLVYMSTPNLPLRYQIENDGTGVASTLEHICTSVISEGGTQDNGVLRYASTEGTHVDCNTINAIYAIAGIRLKSAQIGSVVKLVSLAMTGSTTDDYEWLVIINPTVAVPLTYIDETSSSVQFAVGNATPANNTVTGGTKMIGGLVKAGGGTGSITVDVDNALLLGAAIDGTVDEIVLCCRPLGSNADIDGGITWRELS